MRGIKNSIVDRASEFVIRHARFSSEAPNNRYAVRYPATASRALFSDDTHELVEQVARIMNQETRKKPTK